MNCVNVNRKNVSILSGMNLFDIYEFLRLSFLAFLLVFARRFLSANDIRGFGARNPRCCLQSLVMKYSSWMSTPFRIVVYRHIQSLGLQRVHETHNGDRAFLESFFGLPFLKPEEVEDCLFMDLPPDFANRFSNP